MSTASLRKWWLRFKVRHIVAADPYDRQPEGTPKARDVIAQPLSRGRIRVWCYPQMVNGRYLGSTLGVRVFAHNPAEAAEVIAAGRGLNPSAQ